MKLYFRKEDPELGFLSNFYVKPFEYSNRIWDSSEHAYQAMKSPYENIQEYIRSAPTPNEAKKRGRAIPKYSLRKEWEVPNVRISFMEDILNWKFLDPELELRLLNTNDVELVEYAPWGDIFWGVDKNYEGENHLGKLLVKIREEKKNARR